MSTAVTAAGPGGVIICLDKGSYGGVSFNQSLTISCGPDLWEPPSSGVQIITTAGADVVIEGLVVDGIWNSVAPIVFNGQGSLHLHNIRLGNAGGSIGLAFVPTGPATLHVSDSVFYHLGGSGILVKPTGSGSANVHIRNVKVDRALHGVFADGTASTVGINVNISDSLFAENSGNGIGA